MKIQPTPERLAKLATCLAEEAKNLPETNMFGDANDLEGYKQASELATWCIGKTSKELATKKESLDKLEDTNQDRYDLLVGVLYFALSIDDTVYRDSGLE